MSFIYSQTDAWNTAGTVFAAIQMNVSNGAIPAANPVAAASSQLLNLQTNGTQNLGVRMPHVVSGSDATPFLNLADTWNTTGNITGIKYNATNTASGASSLLLDLQLGGTSQFNIGKTGVVTISPSAQATNIGSVTITRVNSSSSGLDIIGNAFGGKQLRMFAPGEYSALTPSMYFNDSNFMFLKAPLTISGTSTGSGDGYNITPPSLDSFMFGIWSDVQTAFQTRTNLANGGRHWTALDRNGKYCLSVEELGNINWASSASTYVMDTSLSRTAAGTLGVGNGTAGDISGTFLATILKLGGSSDLIFSRAAAATLQLGGADIAAPIAQTVQVQNVLTGTTNTAAQPFTIKGAAGTGTAAGGDIVFQVAPTGGVSGGTQGTFVTALTIKGAVGGQVFFASSLCGASQFASMQFGGAALGSNGQAAVQANIGAAGNPGLVVRAAGQYTWSSNSDPFGTAPDTFLTRPSAAKIQLGDVDTASPVAQTLQVQSVVAGTSNTPGQNFTIIGSKSTGNAAGGSILFQTSPAGGSGSTQNTPVTALTLDSTGSATVAGTMSAGGTLKSSTNVWSNSGGSATALFLGSLSNPLTGPAAATMQLGAPDAGAPVAQTLQVQNVVAGTSNTSGVNWTLNGSLSTGSGTSGDIIFQTGGTGAGATSQNALVTALTIKGATQQVIMATTPRISVAPTANSSASTTITSGADSSTNCGHRIQLNLNGVTYWIPCSSVAF